MTSVPTVLLADDEPVTRLGIRMALERNGMSVVGEAVDGRGAGDEARRCHADVALVDVGLPGGGIATAAEIVAADPITRVIMLAAASSDDDLLEALRAGAIGYLVKDIGPDSLARAVRGAVNGEAPLPRTLAARVIEELQTRSGARRVMSAGGGAVTLSPRESLVLELLRRGLTTKQIARRLGVSPITVRRHVSDTVHRLGAADRAGALELTAPTALR